MLTTSLTRLRLSLFACIVVNDRLEAIESAYKAKDFAAFGKVTMQDSNQFHATCLDTFPPIFYLNEVSRKIIHLVHAYNAHVGRIQAAYTFDAGPNAVIFLEEQHVQEVMSLLLKSFPSSSATAIDIKSSVPVDRDAPVSGTLLASSSSFKLPAPTQDGIKMFYVSRVGGGTRVLDTSEALVDAQTGDPIFTPQPEEEEEEDKQRTQRAGCFWERKIQESAWFRYAVAAAAVGSIAVAAMASRR